MIATDNQAAMVRDDDQSGQTWTTRRLLTWTSQYFARHGVDSHRLAAEMLLAHVLGVPRLQLYTEPERPASELERVALRELVERAARHEPVDYLTGQSPFFSLMLHVTPAVLIPRPSTETLVEHVIQHARRTPEFASPLVIELGTGSGAMAIALAKHVPGCRVIATDISADALEVARNNAQQHGVADQIEFHHGDLFEPLPADLHAQYVMSNPPYISDDEWQQVAPNVKNYEPHRALLGGADGLKFIRPILAGARRFLDKPGQLVLEIAASQKTQVLQLAGLDPGLANAHVLTDHESLPRVLVADSV